MAEEPIFQADRVFLHLSDIHFRSGQAGDNHDPDKDLRNELERDLRTISTTLVKGIDGIIVSGDIAFGGMPDEFDFAKLWLQRISELVDCPQDGVMVTPGNHDVNRELLDEGSEIDLLQTAIRAPKTLPKRDKALADTLRDHGSGPKLCSPIEAYNAFAHDYGCVVTPGNPYWERRFGLGHGGELLIRGMTSTFISGRKDDVDTHKMLYGAGQRETLTRHDNVFRVVVGHHPPSWTIEGDVADKTFSERSVLQLFGHKHDHWLTPAGKGIRLIAGAVHPDRAESHWEPRYSLIALRLDPDKRLQIRVFPRKWTRDEMMFMAHFNPEGQNFRHHTVEP